MTTIDKWMERLALFAAAIGGLALVAMTIMAVVSIIGRYFIWLGAGPVPGDFELIEAGTGFAVCAFMPWTQLKRGHASVTIITDALGQRVNALIDFITELVLFAVAAFLTWRLWYGVIDKMAYGETTFILKFPLWWAYAACLFGLAIWIVVGGWSAFASFMRLVRGEAAPQAGAVH